MKEIYLHEYALIEKLEQENKKLLKCVEFYADTYNWESEMGYAGYEGLYIDEDLSGKLARQTLKEIGE